MDDDDSLLPPSYLDYFFAFCGAMQNDTLDLSANTTPDTLEAGINWWYEHPSLLAAMCVDDAMTWQQSGQLMSVGQFSQVMDGRGDSMPCTDEQMLFAMRLAACMEERELIAELLGSMLMELDSSIVKPRGGKGKPMGGKGKGKPRI